MGASLSFVLLSAYNLFLPDPLPVGYSFRARGFDGEISGIMTDYPNSRMMQIYLAVTENISEPLPAPPSSATKLTRTKTGMRPPYPSPVGTWRNGSYPAIDPTLRQLSHVGQTVIVTGAGSGIGQATCRAYAQAGASRIILIGRRASKLEETRKLVMDVREACETLIFPCSVTDVQAMKGIASRIQNWDVLIMCAGQACPPSKVEECNPDQWWDVLETNLRGNFSTLHAFLPVRHRGARIVGASAGIVNLSATYPPCQGQSAYISSKMAQIRLLEHVAAECPDVFTVSVHPGIVETDLMKESSMGSGGVEASNLDDVDLAAHFTVWATSEEGAFLRGKFCWANWDVEQLKARSREILETPIFTQNIVG